MRDVEMSSKKKGGKLCSSSSQEESTNEKYISWCHCLMPEGVQAGAN